MSHRLVLSYTPIFLHPYLFLTLLTRQAGFTIAYTRKAAIAAYLSTVITRQASIAAKWPRRFMVKFFVWSAFNGYCIVLFLYIFIALLTVHTNQKHFQCKRPSEKRAVLRERKEALGSPVSKVDRVERVGSCRRKELVMSYRTCTNLASYKKANSDMSDVHGRAVS